MSGMGSSGIAIVHPPGGTRTHWSRGARRTPVDVAWSRDRDDRAPDEDASAPKLPNPLPTSAPAAAPVPVAGDLTGGGPEFDAFFRRYEQPLYGYLRRMLPSDEVAVELAQETFFRAWRHFEELSGYERPEAWLYRVATNLAISHLRRKRAFSFSQVFKRGAEGDATELVGEHELLADGLDVERQTAERDLIARVLRRLPERQRAALLLRAVYGHSCAEVARALGISLPNARQTLSRGRERFRRLYEAEQSEGQP